MTSFKPSCRRTATNGERRSKQAALGRELRRVYKETIEEETPDAFLDLLKTADEKTKNRTANKAG